MPIVDVRNIPTVVEFAPDNKVIEFTEEDVTAEVVVGPTVVEFSWGRLIPEPGLRGGGVFQGDVPIGPWIPGLPTNSEAVDPENDYIMLWDASSDTHVKVLADLGGDEIEWATHAEVNAGAPRYKAVDPETGAYAYDRLRHVGQHAAGKGTQTVVLIPDTGVVTIDGALSNVFYLTLTSDVEFANPINPINGQTINIHLKQNVEGGWNVSEWGSQWKFVNKINPELSPNPNAIDLLSCQWNEIDGIMECSFLPNYGSGFVDPPPPTAADLTFVNVGGANNVYRDRDGLNVNFRTLAAEGDIQVRTEGDQIIYSYTAPVAVDYSAVPFLINGDPAEYPNLLYVRQIVAGTGIAIDTLTDGAFTISSDLVPIPPGGTTAQVLSKLSDAEYDVAWVNPPEGGGAEFPPGGTTGQALVKLSAADSDVGWGTVSGGGGGGDSTTVIVNSGVGLNRGFEVNDDFLGRVQGSYGVGGPTWLAYTSSGSVTYLDGEVGAPGILRLTTGVSASGIGGATYGNINASGTYGPIKPGGGEIVFEARVRVPVAPDGTNQFSARIGLQSDAVGAPDDGIYISTSGSAASWVAITRAANTSTTGSNTALTANVWQMLKIVINATCTEAKFYVDGTLFHTETTGFPTAGLTLSLSISKSAGTTDRTVDIDAVRCYQILSTPRAFTVPTDPLNSGCIVARGALQSFNTTSQAVSWDTEVQDDEGYWSALNPTRITFPTAGWYTLCGTSVQSGDADDMQRLYFSKNGAAYAVTQNQTRLGAGSTAVAVGSQLVETAYFAAGDYVELIVSNRSGTSTCYCRLSVIRHGGTTGAQGATGPAGVQGKQMIRRQAADLSILSSTTFTDSDLKVSLEAGRMYTFDVFAFEDCHATPDYKRQLNYTGTATEVNSIALVALNGVAYMGQSQSLPHAGTLTTTAIHTTQWRGSFKTTTAGVFSYQLAQATSNASFPARLKAGAVLIVQDITNELGQTIDTEIAADSPRGYWKLDESSGNLADSSGNGYTLTITGAPIDYYAFSATNPDFPTRKTPIANTGGQSNYAASATALGLSLPVTTYTMEVWGRWTSSGVLMAIGANGETAVTNFAGQLLVTSGGLLSQFWEYSTGTNAPTINSFLGGILDGKLHHLVSTKNAATRTISYYIDGQYVGGGTYTAGQEHTDGTSGIFSIMGSPGDSTAAPDGQYCGAAFYTTVLSEARIQAHARALGLF